MQSSVRTLLLSTCLLVVSVVSCTEVRPSEPLTPSLAMTAGTQETIPLSPSPTHELPEPTATYDPQATVPPRPTVVEPGLAYGIPCKPPCWQGLTPGESTGLEARHTVEYLQSNEWVTQVIRQTGGYAITLSPYTIPGKVFVHMDEHSIVGAIHGTMLFDQSIGALVEQFGAPEMLVMLTDGLSCSSCDTWEPPESVTPRNFPIHVLYPTQGLWFMVLAPSTGTGCICPEMEVTHFCYYAPMTVERALTDDHLADLCAIYGLTNRDEEDQVEWHGFGGGY